VKAVPLFPLPDAVAAAPGAYAVRETGWCVTCRQGRVGSCSRHPGVPLVRAVVVVVPAPERPTP
jgi:hypothetical protein